MCSFRVKELLYRNVLHFHQLFTRSSCLHYIGSHLYCVHFYSCMSGGPATGQPSQKVNTLLLGFLYLTACLSPTLHKPANHCKWDASQLYLVAAQCCLPVFKVFIGGVTLESCCTSPSPVMLHFLPISSKPVVSR